MKRELTIKIIEVVVDLSGEFELDHAKELRLTLQQAKDFNKVVELVEETLVFSHTDNEVVAPIEWLDYEVYYNDHLMFAASGYSFHGSQIMTYII